MRKEYNKLVRDNIPEIIAGDGKTAKTRVLSGAEYRAFLEDKLSEEVGEYLGSGDVLEICDIIEVLIALADVLGVSQDRLEKMRKDKAAKNGAFKERLLLEYVDDC